MMFMIIRIVVVLPAPLGPSRPNIAPFGTLEGEVVDGLEAAEGSWRRAPARSRFPWGSRIITDSLGRGLRKVGHGPLRGGWVSLDACAATSAPWPTSRPRPPSAEIRASSLQFVRKLSGANKPSRANEALFHRTVDEVAAAAERLVHGWVTNAPPKDRDVEIRKMIEKSRIRFGKEPKRTPIDPIR